MFLPNTKKINKFHQKKSFVSWPGLTPDLIRKHSPLSIPTAKLHLDRDKQGLESTKILIDP